MNRSRLLIAGGIAVGMLVVAQAIRPDRTNPVPDPALDVTAKTSIPADTAKLLYRACGDCHSDRTVWPWYSQITPVNWWIAGHVDEGRGELNLSEWTYDDNKVRRKLDGIAHEVSEGDMPPAYYPPFHPETKLSDAERTAITSWAKAELDKHENPAPAP